MSFQRRPPPLDLKATGADTSPTRVGGLGLRAKSAANLPTGTGKAAAAAAERASRGGSASASLAGVDLEEELEHVHMELRTFLNKKRARKAGVVGVAHQEGTPGSASKGGQVRVYATPSFFARLGVDDANVWLHGGLSSHSSGLLLAKLLLLVLLQPPVLRY